MARSLWMVVLAFGLLVAGEAHAQFANRSIGLSVGYMKIEADQGVSWAVPLSLEGSLYIEGGFDLTLRASGMVLTTQTTNQQILGAGVNPGVRYLFSEESFRPFLGAELAFLYIHRNTDTSVLFGLGPTVGFEYFLSDAWSFGPRGFATFYIELNKPLRSTFGGQLAVATHF